MDDFYNGGAFLRRWFIDNTGQAVCPFNAVEVATTAQADIDVILAANAVVRERIAAVEAYEAAQRVRSGDQPPRDETYLDEDGEEQTRWSDAYREWWDAGNLIEDVTPETVALAGIRETGGVTVDEEAGETIQPDLLTDVYVFANPVVPVPTTISDRQFFQALALRGEITEDEALEAVGSGIIPAAMDALVDALPVDQRFGARMLLRGAVEFQRSHPLSALIGQLYEWRDDEIDALWRDAEGL